MDDSTFTEQAARFLFEHGGTLIKAGLVACVMWALYKDLKPTTPDPRPESKHRR